MDIAPHTPAAPANVPAERPETSVDRGIAVASISLGFFSMVVFFWHPFSTCLSAVGLTLGVISLLRGVRGGLHGERLALGGTALCAVSLSITLTLNQFLRFVQWDH